MQFIRPRSEEIALKLELKNKKYMADNQKFPQGLRAFKPNDKAPGYVKGNFQVNRDELVKWLNEQPGTFRLVLKESQKGPWFLMVDDYQPKQEPNHSLPASDPADDLPF